MYSATEALHNLQWTPLLERRRRHRCVAVYKCLNDLMEIEYNMITNNMVHSYSTRVENNLHLPKVKTEWGKQRFAFHAAKEWNELDIQLRNAPSLNVFKRTLSMVLNL